MTPQRFDSINWIMFHYLVVLRVVGLWLVAPVVLDKDNDPTYIIIIILSDNYCTKIVLTSTFDC